MLSAEKVLNEANKCSALPDFGGLKFFSQNEHNKEQQQESVRCALQQYAGALQEQRVPRKMNVCVAVWQPDQHVASVTTIKGSVIQKFGYQTRSGKFLFPEEALFLLDQGILELYFEDMQLTFQEAYMVLLPVLPSLEFYQVFAHLCRQGFVVSRYKLTQREPELCHEAMESSSSTVPSENTTSSSPNEVTLKCSEPELCHEAMESSSSTVPSENTKSSSPNEVTLKCSEPELCHEAMESSSSTVPSENTTSSSPNEVTPGVQSPPECLATGYMKHLWNGVYRPLIKPSDAKDTGTILSKLRLSPMEHLKTCIFPHADTDDEVSTFQIDFDVFMSKESKKKQKKEQKTQPRFRVVVCRYADTPPSLLELSRLTQKADGVCLKIGLVKQGSVSYYEIFSTDLPTLLPMP